MELIDKAAIVAEIERLKFIYSDDENIHHVARYNILVYILSFLDTLEVKEIEQEKSKWACIDDIGFASKYDTRPFDGRDIDRIAKHFFELGIKTRDWREERMKECPYRRVGCTMYSGTILECRGACSWVVDYPKLKELEEKKGE